MTSDDGLRLRFLQAAARFGWPGLVPFAAPTTPSSDPDHEPEPVLASSTPPPQLLRTVDGDDGESPRLVTNTHRRRQHFARLLDSSSSSSSSAASTPDMKLSNRSRQRMVLVSSDDSEDDEPQRRAMFLDEVAEDDHDGFIVDDDDDDDDEDGGDGGDDGEDSDEEDSENHFGRSITCSSESGVDSEDDPDDDNREDDDDENCAPTTNDTWTAKSFGTHKEHLARQLYDEYNRRVFGGRLPEDLPLTWSVYLKTTAGLTRRKKRTFSGLTAASRSCEVSIELSTKVIDSYQRLRQTLAHEMCHAAVWLLDQVEAKPHGPEFHAWGIKFKHHYHDISVERCHSYDIQYKHTYMCTQCSLTYGRHSKSIDVTAVKCGRCMGRLVLRQNNGTSTSR